MNIRAHHLLCMKYFKGRGYSKEFISNFSNVMKGLEGNPAIRITNCPDIICSSCPYNMDEKCIKKGPDSEGRVREKDNLVIKRMGLMLDQETKARDAGDLIESRLEQVREICKDCEWLEYCR